MLTGSVALYTFVVTMGRFCRFCQANTVVANDVAERIMKVQSFLNSKRLFNDSVCRRGIYITAVSVAKGTL